MAVDESFGEATLAWDDCQSESHRVPLIRIHEWTADNVAMLLQGRPLNLSTVEIADDLFENIIDPDDLSTARHSSYD
jgi:hypothetical protein